MSLTSSIPLGITGDDLAPADFRSAEFDWTGFTISFIDSMQHPRFELGYDALWREFGHRNEMEQRDVIAQRFEWRPERAVERHALLYEMVVIMHEDQLAAVRDHTAIVDLQHPDEPVIVHLSHLLVMPRYRGSGIAGWMRAAPIRTARECLSRARQPRRPITLVAEMEPADPAIPDRMQRLAAYEKVGFVKIDPNHVPYLQPDFRSAAEIDASGAPTPVPLSLVVRRVRRESEPSITGREARSLVESLYTMYAQTFRKQDMRPNYASLEHYPDDGSTIKLVAPTRPD
jgi:GNAT superfamily N-acetyltransferase